MKYVERDGLKLSVFQLGTVQLGMNYGLGEHTAKPDTEYAYSLLDKAMELGVNALDTANNYGESEARIGAWLKARDVKNRPFIITKIGPFDHSSLEALREDIFKQTEACRKTLGIDTIDMLMVHSVEDYEMNPDAVREAFFEMKASGIIRYTAISAYSYNDYRVIAESGFDAVQIPINIFDHSQIECGGIRALADAGMMIFARSVFLQGLVFQTPKTLDPRMNFCLEYLEKFISLCHEFDMSPAALAASFVHTLPGITSLVLGCQTHEQLTENASLVDKIRKLSDKEMAKLADAFRNIDPRVINPKLWFNKF